MDDRASTGDRADEETPGRLNMKVAGPAMAAGAVSLGLVLIGACGIGHKDVYVAPPPLAADLQVATTPITRSGTTTAPAVIIPPSPSWRVAANTPARRTTSATATSTTTEADPSYTAFAPPVPTTTTTTQTPPPTTEPSAGEPSADSDTTTTTRPHHTPRTVEESAPTADPYLAPTTEDAGN
ncbi:hypothetical protein A5780_30835 [Nocardia sp. 852002-20019_SCH5090214]|jgi:hypothetical protein|uniref:Mucin n=1 Tax=Nocardia nova TaxID=37330 RepID=A0A2S6A1L3_9NOCA|nr:MULTISPECIES: hypothetical protein [Nocardia]OBF86557.1 hypothetical protein A9X06_12690 [Mycobacterium sp. 852002-51759_SCH5129042]MBF6275506.1 hypothetical protein [Nocardia nova]MBV7704786.1 hypothetical protein [Nocardia nova]OBA50773.1 hypothetical protein A5780_30835 [Nocardia sp. 852002-20019_SCH5090214]OBA56328.1 hypothetical protein A5789_19265 [Nocardia sp. 852002-51101_SCH5132738]